MCEIAINKTYCPFRVGGTRTTPTDWGVLVKTMARELDLFDEYRTPNVVDIKTLKNYSFDDFKSNGMVVNEKYSDTLSEFIEKYNKVNGKPFYNLSLSYNTIMDDNHYKFLLIGIDKDVVFVCYKVIQIVKTKQIRFIGLPVSKNNCIANQHIILDILRKIKFARIVTYYNNQLRGDRLIEYDDYYINLYEKGETYETSRYRSKTYLNQIEKNKQVKIEYTKIPITKDCLKLRQAWKDGMEKRGSRVSTESDKKFVKLIKSNHKDLRFICIYFRDMIVSLQVFLLSKDKKYCDCLYIHHLWEASDEIEKMMLKNITKIQNYFAYLFLFKKDGCRVMYLAGCRPSERRLLKHKQRICDGKIEYYIK